MINFISERKPKLMIASLFLWVMFTVQCSVIKNDTPISFSSWAEGNIFRISGLALSDSDQYSFIDSMLEGRKIIAVGEATHGTHEFFQIKNQIFKYLVENKGFEIYALEAGYFETRKINDYVTQGIGDPEQLVLNLTQWSWKTYEVVELIRWMRDYNVANNANLKFYGFDIGNTIWHSRDYVREEISNDAPNLLTSYEEIIDSVFDKETQKGEVILRLEQLEQKALESNLSSDTKFLIGLYSKEIESWISARNSRDLYMAEIISHIYITQERRGMFLSMHNYHLDKSDKYLGYRGETEKTYIPAPDRTTGFYLAEQYQDEFYAIGFEFNKGSFNAPYRDEEGKFLVKPYEFQDASETLFASDLSKIGLNMYLTEIDEGVIEFQAINKMHQFGGFTPRRRSTNDIKLVDSYDALIFVDTTTPSRRIIP